MRSERQIKSSLTRKYEKKHVMKWIYLRKASMPKALFGRVIEWPIGFGLFYLSRFCWLGNGPQKIRLRDKIKNRPKKVFLRIISVVLITY